LIGLTRWNRTTSFDTRDPERGEALTPRLRYSGSSIGYQLASITAGGPAPLIATALLAWTGAVPASGYVIACYIALCAVVSIIATLLMPDHTNKDISQERA